MQIATVSIGYILCTPNELTHDTANFIEHVANINLKASGYTEWLVSKVNVVSDKSDEYVFMLTHSHSLNLLNDIGYDIDGGHMIEHLIETHNHDLLRKLSKCVEYEILFEPRLFIRHENQD